MFDSISGMLLRKDTDGVVLAAGGIGYRLLTSRRTLERLAEGREVTLYTHLAVKDDSMRLYGFETPVERDLFLKILGVAGVGAATALNLLSRFPPAELVEILAGEQVARLQSVKGVGVRTAKRLVLELKGKVERTELPAARPGRDEPVGRREERLGEDLVAALQTLGFPRSASRAAALRTLAENPGSENLEELIKKALRFL